MEVTVAICTYNPNTGTLRRALDAIVAQLHEVPSAELIVVDNNSKPALAGQEFLASYPIRLICEPTPGLTAAREAAINNAEGDVIVFVDDDNVLDDHYLVTAFDWFLQDPKLGLLGGRILPEYEAQPPPWFGEFENWLAIRRYPLELHVETTEPTYSDYFPVGAGLAVRRNLARAYLEDCATAARIEGRRGSALSSGEDLDLGLFILGQGSKLAVTGSLSLTHVISSGRISDEYLQRLAVSNVKSSLELDRKWSSRFGESIYPLQSMSGPEVLLRAAVTGLLGMWSPRYRVKRCVYATLARIRLGMGI
jgi:glycosyltransferase involved in cell wall biosynthesis